VRVPPTDLPRRPARRRGRVGLIVIAAVVFVLLISLRGIAGFWTDYLWFRELKQTGVWRGVLGTKIMLAVVFSVVFFALLFVDLIIADRIAPKFRPAGPEEEFVERYREVVGQRAGLVRIVVALVLTVIAGPAAQGQWNNWLLFRNGSNVKFGTTDPLFHKDVSFYMFKLPFYKFLIDWAFATLIIIVVVTLVAHYLNGGIRLQSPLQRVTPQVKAHLSVLFAVLALLKAVGYYLQRYELNFSTRGTVQGATYTDVKAQLPALKLLMAISLFAAILLIVNISRRGWVLPVIAVGLWAFLAVAVGAAYPAFIQNVRVKPNEADKERTYIARNIKATRAAFNLDPGGGPTKAIAVNAFANDNKLTAQALADNAPTIRNVRLWDKANLKTSYQQLQGFRSYYEFNDVDVDRYTLGTPADTTQVWLSLRELLPSGVPNSWVNRHLVFTHGYGAVMSPANAVTSAGNPDLVIHDLPPKSEQGAPTIDQQAAAIYYGEGLPGFSVVHTDQAELDYPTGTKDVTTTYQGKGGVKMSSVLRRAAFFLRFGDYNLLVSGSIKPSSRILYIRDIKDRVRKLAPFLKYDGDPYPVVVGGRIEWIQDAYTTSNKYPYSQSADGSRALGDLASGGFNYIRNSVKIVVDAYDGTMKLYAWDTSDPILRVYQKAFPKLFTDANEMPAALRQHLRYPEDLFKVQTNMYTRYHMTDPTTFYKQSDLWDIAQDPGSGQVTATPTTLPSVAVPGQVAGPSDRLDPYYLLMRLPNEQQESFLILQPFVPHSDNNSRKNMTAFMIAKSDPGDFGRLEAFVMPEDQQVIGPAQVDGLINQDPNFSPQISLLNQSGSKVIQGNLLVIPVNQSLLYIRPYFVEAANTPVPQLKKVAVVYAGKVAVANTLKDALNSLFGGGAQTLEQAPGSSTPTPPTTPGGTISPQVSTLLDQALQEFTLADQALKSGDLAGYQSHTKKGEDLVQQAASASQSSTTSTTTPSATTTTAKPTST
jgi:uncharacterized membrane protein (UPF0182 family)